MNILIKGMEMPQGCGDCPCLGGEYHGSYDNHFYCQVTDKGIGEHKPDWCPLIEVPEDVQPVKWISVYDQLPDYNMVVLVTDGEDVGTGYRYALGETGFMGWAVPFADIEEDDVSHWMPLPEPPKDGET